MSITGIDASNFLSSGSGLGFGAAADEVLLSGWQFEPIGEASGNLCSLFSNLGLGRDNSRELAAGPAGNPLAVLVDDASSILSVNASADNPNDTWYNLVGWYFLNTDLEVWVDGGDKGVGSNGLGTVAAPTNFRIGLRKDDGGFDVSTAYGEISAWDPDGFDVTDRDNLAALIASGANPLAINAQGGQPWLGRLVAYWRLTDTGDTDDLSGNGFHLSATGAIANFGTHPPVDPVPTFTGHGLRVAGLRNRKVIS